MGIRWGSACQSVEPFANVLEDSLSAPKFKLLKGNRVPLPTHDQQSEKEVS